MNLDKRVVFAAAMCGALAAGSCGTDAPAQSPAPAAKVTSPVKESELATITLTPEAEARLGIETGLTERKGLARTRTVGGEVVAVPGTEITISAPLAGTLDSSLATPMPGTSVAQGRTLFRLVPLAPSERDAGLDAQRAVDEAAARHEMAEKRVQRAELLAKDGAGSRRAAEEARADLAIAAAALKAARTRLGLAVNGNATTGSIELDAPYPGLIRTLHVSRGQAVASGAPLVDLLRTDTVWVRVPLYVGEADDIDPAASVQIVGLGDPADAQGTVARPVEAPPSADPSTAAVDLYFALANSESAFRPGQRVGVKLTTRSATERLVVPRAAVLHDAYGGSWVYEVKAPHVFVRRRVSIVDLTGTLAVLDQGLAPGTRVVTAGAAELFGTEFGAGK